MKKNITIYWCLIETDIGTRHYRMERFENEVKIDIYDWLVDKTKSIESENNCGAIIMEFKVTTQEIS